MIRKMTEREVEVFKEGREAFDCGADLFDDNPYCQHKAPAENLEAAWRAGWIEGEKEAADPFTGVHQ